MTTPKAITMESASSEQFDIPIRSEDDPTGAAVEFELTLTTVTSPTGSWTAGTWPGTWDSGSKRVTARTPTIGPAGLVVAEGSSYWLWIRYSSTVIEKAGRIGVT